MIFDLRNLVLILLILLLGFITSWSDTKKRKISNKFVLGFLLVGFILNFSTNILDFRINYLLNLLFAFFVGFLLWYINFWNAGDGKLFFAFVSLVPVSLVFLDKTHLYSYDIIVYTFVPIFFVFLVFLIFQTSKVEFIHALRESFKPKVIFNIFVAFFSFQWFIQLANANLGLRLNLFISAIILFFIFDGLEKILKLKLINLFYITATIRLFVDASNIFSLWFISHFLFQISIFLVFVYFFLNIAYFKFGVHVKIPDLKPGMLLCEKIIKKGNICTVEPDIKISLFMFLQAKTSKKKPFIDIKPKGLTLKEIQKLQELNKVGKMEVGAVLIQKRVPYAPFQFLGVIILLIINVI